MKPNYLLLSIAVVCLAGVSFAESTPENISTAMCSFYNTLKGALAVGMMLLTVLAAIVYAVGQMLGAETRARASVWATAMFVGAIIGALIYIIMPYILGILMGPENFDPATACSGGNGGGVPIADVNPPPIKNVPKHPLLPEPT
jgi:ABC-type xylose transport system permease subunit